MHPFAYLMEKVPPLAKKFISNGHDFYSNSSNRCTNKDPQHYLAINGDCPSGLTFLFLNLA
jgi:hypothetical protein